MDLPKDKNGRSGKGGAPKWTCGRLRVGMITRARDEMFMATDTPWAPWFVARSDDKRRARLNIIDHLLSNIPYERMPRAKVKLPERHIAKADQTSRMPLKIIAEVY